MERIVIAGATGTIGMALINKCISEKVEALILVRPDSRRKEQIPSDSKIRVIECGLEDMQSAAQQKWIETVGKCSVFYHLAWNGTFGESRNNMYLQNRNVKYTLDAVELARRLGCHTFVGAGSQAEYGRVEGKLNSSIPTYPENGYGIAKLCAGQMSRIRCHQLGMKHIWTRILSVYGPYDSENTMIMSTIRQLLHRERPSLTKGEQYWDYLYSEDAANALLLLGNKGISDKIYCIGSGQTMPLAAYIDQLRDAIDPQLPLGYGDIPYAPLQVMSLCADIGELMRDTGFVPRVTFEDGIRNTINWVKSR